MRQIIICRSLFDIKVHYIDKYQIKISTKYIIESLYFQKSGYKVDVVTINISAHLLIS